MEEVTRLKDELQKLITSQQTLDLVNTELTRLIDDIVRIERNNIYKDDVIIKLKDQVFILNSNLKSSGKRK